MLPQRVPRSRIIAYNYISRWDTNAPRARLQFLGESLIADLHDFKEGNRDRPIIFVGHSLGGLVIAYALLYAARIEAYEYLANSTVGFVSLGAPFRGTKMQKLADLAAKITILAGSQRTIIRDLNIDNEMLWDKLRELYQLQKRLAVPIYCFFELFDTDYGKRFAPEGFASEGLNTDHLKMNKFAGPTDQSFLRVSAQIRRMSNDWKQVMQRRKSEYSVAPFLIPFDRNSSFVGRDTILDRLMPRVRQPSKQDLCKRTILEGLGGIGKTSNALEAAFCIRDENSDCCVFWAPAVTINMFESAFRDIGHALKVPGIDSPDADVKSLVKSALDQLSKPLLLIIDNVDDPSLFVGSATLNQYLPNSRAGSLLFTTRTRDIAAKLDIRPADVVRIEELSRSDAQIMLREHLKKELIRDTESTSKLLDFLADLPLAIKQAAAYMHEKDMDTTKYLHYCISSDKNMTQLLSKDFYDRGRYKTIQNPITTTWMVSFRHILENFPLAAKCMMNISLLAEKDAPKILITPAEDTRVDDLDIDEAIGTLKAYSFITQRIDQELYTTHRLVRLAMRNWLNQEGQLQGCVNSIAQTFTRIYPRPEHDNKDCWIKLLSLGEELVRDAELVTDTDVYLALLFKIGESHALLGKWSQAAPLCEMRLKKATMLQGTEHRGTLLCMWTLATSYWMQGRKNEVYDLIVAVVKTQQDSLGDEHPDTLNSLDSLGVMYSSEGKLDKAAELQSGVVELRKRTLGNEHPATVGSQSCLELTYWRQMRYPEAERLYLQVTRSRTESLGEDHPDTLASLSNLGLVYLLQGRAIEAEEIFVSVLERRKLLQGIEHPDTVTGMHNVARVYRQLGRFREAEHLGTEAANAFTRLFGEEHPSTVTSLCGVMGTLIVQKKYDEAEKLALRVYEIQKKVLGDLHPDTRDTMAGLGVIYHNMGLWSMAEKFRVQYLEMQKQVLGDKHVLTLTAMHNLAWTYRAQGQSQRAQSMMEECRLLSTTVLGQVHSLTETCATTLADWQTEDRVEGGIKPQP
ncbi:TPR-like protein [Myriangium duriaei CBS 260.36]|uniref:TPR-like protein n=1 Tax=Myriangium duriaei CBS 260.36 TaxID=1168546 RepID=A0A9P4MFP0_9PEZI|nr:TPR-like protein [Myriangium duriaei CBS 260.36]